MQLHYSTSLARTIPPSLSLRLLLSDIVDLVDPLLQLDLLLRWHLWRPSHPWLFPYTSLFRSSSSSHSCPADGSCPLGCRCSSRRCIALRHSPHTRLHYSTFLATPILLRLSRL